MTPDPDMQPQFYDGIPTKRLFAWITDTIVIVLFCLLILPFTAFTGVFFFPLLMLVVGFIYRCGTLANGSATWGMRLMSMEIRQANDRPLDGGMAILHTLGYSFSIAMMPLQLISIVLMVTSARKQGLTDMALGTVALNKRR
jgi:uncharacterized RDD family membrane protein YckC